MKLIGAIHKFNTGRLYASNGQEISWAVIDREPEHGRVVAFIDHSRMIDGVVDLHLGNLDLITDRWVLAAYDDHHFHYGSGEVRFLQEQMKAKGV